MSTTKLKINFVHSNENSIETFTLYIVRSSNEEGEKGKKEESLKYFHCKHSEKN